MKNVYTTPAVEVLEYISEQMIAASDANGVSSENGIGYGGIDLSGTVEADTRIIFNDFLFE